MQHKNFQTISNIVVKYEMTKQYMIPTTSDCPLKLTKYKKWDP